MALKTPTAQQIAEMQAELARLQAENATLKANEKPLKIQVGKTGVLSVYGLQRFPVSLYRSQWRRLIDFVPQLEASMIENAKLCEVREEATRKEREAKKEEERAAKQSA